jgi:altered-inheritance-of-mitochondria protein 13
MSELDTEVEAAREGVIQCLRSHDRRPLDCWKEVAMFRDVVGRLEERWVEKVVR